MEFRWQYAKAHLKKLDSPGYGCDDQWMRWYEKAWALLSDAGLTRVATRLDDLRVRMRIFALCWLAHDYCAAVLDNEYASCPDWQDWCRQLELSPVWALLIDRDDKRVETIVAESCVSSVEAIWDDGDEEGFTFDGDELNDDLFCRLMLTAVYLQRRQVVSALLKAMGGAGPLFVSMHANCYSRDDIIEQKQDELQRELERLEEQLEDEDSDDNAAALKQEAEAVRDQLDHELLVQQAEDEILDRISGTVVIGEEDSIERLRGSEWCCEGCRIIVRGAPEFNLP